MCLCKDNCDNRLLNHESKISEKHPLALKDGIIFWYMTQYYFYKSNESINGYTDNLLFNGGMEASDIIFNHFINRKNI